jgi:hypothetical protein
LEIHGDDDRIKKACKKNGYSLKRSPWVGSAFLLRLPKGEETSFLWPDAAVDERIKRIAAKNEHSQPVTWLMTKSDWKFWKNQTKFFRVQNRRQFKQIVHLRF